jgi:hypothetical protein
MKAWREGQHDDLVLAVALVCWAAEVEPPIISRPWTAEQVRLLIDWRG